MFIVSQIYPLSALIFIDDKIVKIGNMYKKKKKKRKKVTAGNPEILVFNSNPDN